MTINSPVQRSDYKQGVQVENIYLNIQVSFQENTTKVRNDALEIECKLVSCKEGQ